MLFPVYLFVYRTDGIQVVLRNARPVHKILYLES